MNIWLVCGLSALSAFLFAVAVFIRAQAVVQQRRSLKTLVFKLLGFVGLFFAVWLGRENILEVALTFFVTAPIFMGLVILARHKFLR